MHRRTSPAATRSLAISTAAALRSLAISTAAALRSLAIGTAAVAALAGCAHPVPPVLPGTEASSPGPGGMPADAGRLARLVATSEDHHYQASYVLTTTRTLTVTVAADGSWLVTIPGGALSGTADIAIAQTGGGRYECRLDGLAHCVRFGAADAVLAAWADPQWEHVFTDWLPVLADRHAAISVAAAANPAAVTGQCFSVEPDATALAAPVPAGVYCFAADGTITAVALAAGSLRLVGTPAPAPDAVSLPGPVVPGSPLPLVAPPSPPASPPASSHAKAASSRR